MKFGTILSAAVLAIIFRNVHSGGEQTAEDVENSVNFFGDQVAGYYSVVENAENQTKADYAARLAEVNNCLDSIKNVTGPEVEDLRAALLDLKDVFSHPPELPEISVDNGTSLGRRRKRQITVVCVIINSQYQNISATLSSIRAYKLSLKGDLVRIEKNLNATLNFLTFFKFLLPLMGSQLLADVGNSVNMTMKKIEPQVPYLDKIELITSNLLGIITDLYTKWCFGTPYATNTSECTSVGDVTPSKPYCYVQKAFTWNEAYDFCYYRGMNLFVVANLAEEYALSKIAKNRTSAGAKLWINGQSVAKKMYAFMPYPVAVFAQIEWVSVVEPDSGCMQITGDVDNTGSFSVDAGICTYRYYSFCQYKKVPAIGK